ncbi:hypothetical protein C1752_06133 [Acaryochloris thomasi RCC1774]|uniref:DUF4278 domain-containing protein n=1 Tax=Acaryochloris thomasi RCC1774 TaxID=1764569 RepID=A0A2W1JBV0_9CYAN|nr:DUF4278 domain-containing protein [Acaryochloris thomasi]PZD71513.1 hypothetical protein C1752_06133 [Acaryochloris thomasi RCC1774]
MQLKYRGVDYEYVPPQVAAKPTELVGTYRGLEWRFKTATSSVQQPTLDLVYRGVAYQTGQHPTVPEKSISSSPAVKAGASAKDMARALMLGHHTLIKHRQQSMLGRVAAEVGLGLEASHYWSHIQGKANPGFRATYDRSPAALS